MHFYRPIIFLFFFASCTDEVKHHNPPKQKPVEQKAIDLNQDEADRLASLPLKCLEQEYPNKLGQVLNSEKELLPPGKLHPVFYGCFDWHSAVHGHWLLVSLLNRFPGLKNAKDIRQTLNKQFTPENIAQEMAFFKVKNNESFERTYGWAWLLKLQEELILWEDPDAKKWSKNLQPLTDLLIEKYLEFLPKILYPIRSGEHTNTAFGLSLAYDYALTSKHDKLKNAIEAKATEFYGKDLDYKLSYEPSGYDFLSPAFQEIDLMRKTMEKSKFLSWLHGFLPELENKSFDLEVARVGDRSDGKLVHLDGLNFSRAWCLYDLSETDKKFTHLRKVADKHLAFSLPSIVDGDYMGEHWLASFAVYALLKKK